ncbi:hypothetical protein GCM10023100_76560 [Actinocorallia cavernae]|uniref:Uncharacterized protein n=3 Tax=Actinomycetota TaxID=201174 RepID=A0ABN3KLE8_9ACTN
MTEEALRLYDSAEAEAIPAARFAALLTMARSHRWTAQFEKALAALAPRQPEPRTARTGDGRPRTEIVGAAERGPRARRVNGP